MQEITLTKIIEMESKISSLLLISIDDCIDTINDSDGVRLEGKINVSGKAKTEVGDKDFFDYIELDIFLAYEEIIDRNALNVTVDDFNYKIDENKLNVNVILKLEGIKEIETTFLTQENNELISKKEIEEENEYKGEMNLDREENEAYLDNEVTVNEQKDELEEINDREMKIMNNEEEKIIEEEIKEEPKIDIKRSLLKSVFANRKAKEEVSWKLHCVKNETTYEEIATKYNVNLNKLISINKNEKLEEGKLIFLPME